jgi:hypothetical protein
MKHRYLQMGPVPSSTESHSCQAKDHGRHGLWASAACAGRGDAKFRQGYKKSCAVGVSASKPDDHQIVSSLAHPQTLGVLDQQMDSPREERVM